MKKHTQNLSTAELSKILAVARGDERPDLLIKNVKILDLVCGDIIDSAIVLSGKIIAGVGKEYESSKARKVWDAKGLTVVPGFIDGHVHIESSMMNPFEFEKMTLPLGTTTAICDPHEITNVLGEKGFNWFLKSALTMYQNLFVQVSSCIPSLPGFESNGANFGIDEMIKYIDHPHVLGMAEMMNFPGVITGDPSVLQKIELFSEMNLDGHCPMLSGKDLNAYIASGIKTCHETIGLEEGREKIQKGMALIIREGSVAKNLKALAPLITEFNSSQCFLCTDDRNPLDINKEGHLNYMIKELINTYNIPEHVAYRVASFSAAKHYNLKRLGLIAPGYQADMVFLKDSKAVDIAEVFIAGKKVSELDWSTLKERLQASNVPDENTIRRDPVTPDNFKFDLIEGEVNVIGVVPEEIVTNHKKIKFNGKKFEDADVLKISVVERYGNELRPAVGFVSGFRMNRGAIASSVAHDSHNIIVVGASDSEMALAVNKLIEDGGGFCVVDGKNVKTSLPLSIAGIMSMEDSDQITDKLGKLKIAYSKLGGELNEPFLQLAFLALPVIPSLKITDKGLVDVNRFEFIDSQGN